MHLLASNLEQQTGSDEPLQLWDPGDIEVGHHHRAGLVGEERKQPRDPVIELVVAERHGVELEQVAEQGDDPPLELCVPDCALVEVPGVEPQRVWLALSDVADSSGQASQSTVTLAWSHNAALATG